MDISALVDEFLPGPGGTLDQLSQRAQDTLAALTESDTGKAIHTALHGNTWLGHPLHAIVIVVPVGAWSLTGWYDLRGALSSDPRHDSTADAALRVGLVTALAAAATGAAQYLDTRGAVRRETAVHAALNWAAVGVYAASWAARKRGHRRLGRLLSTTGLVGLGVSGYLGGDIAYRHGVGMRPQALRSPGRPAADTSDRPLVVNEVAHV